GQDLVEWQLRVAAGQDLPCGQEDLVINGHSFEARIYAEDPANEFLPAAGKLGFLEPPVESDHVRVDSGVVQGDEIGVYYDPMIAKLIVWDEDRKRAAQRLSSALAHYRIRGVTTNIDFLQRVAGHDAFVEGEVHTGFIDQHRNELFLAQDVDLNKLSAAALCFLALMHEQTAVASSEDPTSPWNEHDNWRLNGPGIYRESIIVAGEEMEVSAEEISNHLPRRFRMLSTTEPVEVYGSLDGNALTLGINGIRQQYRFVENENHITLFSSDHVYDFQYVTADASDDQEHHGDDVFEAPMNGTVIETLASTGDRVEQGDTILVMEAMKMEHAIRAPVCGTVGEIYYQVGELVEGGARLLEFEAEG
ncbi:MAG: 3-methylcrotonyl-CoA carboxylase, partial [Proteobacteria bacterium]|nr:3-methylcrotonyl-CoA carboxylase [Pseudomonadota bacterium]